MKKNAILLLAFVMLAFAACNDDDAKTIEANAVAFVNPAINLGADQTNVSVVFATPTTAAGTVTLTVTPTNVVYGEDFTTNPETVSGKIVIPFEANSTSTAFTFNKLQSGHEGVTSNVVFTITEINIAGVTIPEATKSVQLNFDEAPIEVNTVAPGVGGANVPNQVYIDLSAGNQTAVERTKWDLGFFSGDDFRVAINGSLKMAVKKLDITDITQVVTIDNTVAVGEGGGSGVINGNIAYVDGPNGNIKTTAIAEVSATDSENNVYLLNLGYDLSTVAPGVGSVNPYGDARGWRKIRILRNGSDYKLQYANVDATTFQEVTIAKNAAFNFSFFSFKTNSIVTAEPEKAKWDLNFTPFTGQTNFGTGAVSYAYQDFIVINRKGDTRAYQVLNSAGVVYADFTMANVVADNFNLDASIDQRVIGSNWRNGGGPSTLPSPRDDRFYVVKDSAGNIYKVRFIAMTNSAGERGFPTFEYALLQ